MILLEHFEALRSFSKDCKVSGSMGVDPFGPSGLAGPRNNLGWTDSDWPQYFGPFAYSVVIIWSSLVPILSLFII